MIQYNKNYSLKFFYMLILLIWAGLATPLVKFYSPDYPLLFVFNVLILVFYYIKFNYNINIKSLVLILSLYVTWYLAICIKYNGIQSTDLTLVYSTIIAFVSYKVFNFKEFCYYYEKVLVFLSILSLIVWSSAILMPTFVPHLLDKIAIYHAKGINSDNFIIVGLGDQMIAGIRRNLGFAWEAGRFSAFIVIGLFINLNNHDMDVNFKRNKNLYILLVTLASTLSTTGFGAFGGVVLYYLYNKSDSTKLVLIIGILVVLPSFLALPFIGDKILTYMDYQQEVSNMMYTFDNYGETSITPQRITGLYLEWQNFIHDFWFGYNINENSYTINYIFGGYTVWLSDGILQIFSKYGIFMGLFFYINLFKASSFSSNIYRKKGKILFALVFLLVSISYDFWGTGLMLSIIFYPFFEKYNKYKVGSYVTQNKYYNSNL